MSRVQQLAMKSMARLAGKSREDVELADALPEPNREQRRAFVKHSLPRRFRMEAGFGRWRRHRYLSRRTEA